MIERIFTGLAVWLILAVLCVMALVYSLIYKDKFDNDSSMSSALMRTMEGCILAVIGGLLARTFISLLLGWGGDSGAAGLAIGWGFFIIPGLVDTIPYLASGTRILTATDTLLTLATIIGGFAGMANGVWRIYPWDGMGWIAFPLDVTWGLAGNTLSFLVHCINFFGHLLSQLFGDGSWGEHATDSRENAHRYIKGFGLQPGYAFTEGCVMSNLNYPPTDDLFKHEKTHVWQNRMFGALYTLTYVGWILLWIVPATIVAIVKSGISEIGSGFMGWCYFSNPWETWAYIVQGESSRLNIPDSSQQATKDRIWPVGWVVGLSIPYFLGVILLSVLTVKSVWINHTATSASTTHTSGSQKGGKATSHPQPANHGSQPPAKHK